MEKLIDRFIRYAKINTESCSANDTFPSTATQNVLLNLLADELKAMGVEGVTMDKNGYVMGTIPSTCKKPIPAIGFIAHVDTSEDMTGNNVNPQIIECYDGKDIVLNSNVTMKVDDFPQLTNYIGQTLITTDGTTLLGADDKAGVAEIMCATDYLMAHPELEHGEIKVGFTPDEEIGRGVDFFDVERFGAKFAYTMDGSSLGELEYENFNAAMVTISVQGRSVHPGYAKNKMLNAFTVAQKIDSLLPAWERPEHTEGREGFYHLLSMTGSVDAVKMSYIIRDHSKELFKQRKAKMIEVIEMVNKLYNREVATYQMKDQYYNMYEIVSKEMEVVDVAVKAMQAAGVEPVIKPIRGGTDGSRLSFMGLPCPNIFAGGENFHGRFEFASLQTMEKAKEVIIEIAKEWAKR